MFKKVIQNMLILAMIAIGLIVLITGGFWLLTRGEIEGQGPIVSIHSPENGSEINTGVPVGVNSTSRDQDQIITSVELWVYQEGVMELAALTRFEDGSQMVSLTQGWQPLTSGSYRLLVRAFNESGNSGQAAVDIQVVEEDLEEAGAILEGVFPAGMEEEFVPIQPYPGGEGPGGGDPSPPSDPPHPPPPDPDPNPPEIPEFLAGFLNIVIEPFFPFDQTGTWVEVEAVSLNVQEEYQELYCYVGLGENTVQRVPETGSFHVSNTFEWNLPDYLGGNNKRVVFVPENESLDLHLDCWGLDPGNSLHWAGLYKAEHPETDWNGALIEGHSTEGDGLTISYRINPAGGPLLAPTNLRQIIWNNRVLFQWDWMGQVNEIDGYKIYRDNSLVATIKSDIYMTEVPPMWITPPCGEDYRYHIVAYQGSTFSPRSNYLEYQAENCEGVDDFEGFVMISSCENAGNTVDVLYQYSSMHGVATMDLRAVKNGLVVDEIFSSRVPIQHGDGTAQVELTNFGNEPIQTDQLTFYMYDHNNMPFYVETMDHVVNWSAGNPDLTIPLAWVDRPNHKLNIKVKNEGCSGLAVTPFLSFVREADGQTGFHQMTNNLRPGAQELITIDLDPGEMDLWAGEINLTVDPLDKIEERDEDNNQYTIGEARINQVIFTNSIVYDDHDLIGDGEWDVYFTWCKAPCGWWEGSSIYRSYHWGEGEHTISDVQFEPDLGFNDVLMIKVTAKEYDKHNPLNPFTYPGSIGIYHTPDGVNIPSLDNKYTHMGTWKTGGTFAVPGEDWLIAYKIVMEEY